MGEASATMQEDFSTVCRTCATVTEFVMPIFEGEGLQNNLADKIHKHLPIKVSAQDVLPLVVCYQCASTLLAWHELVMCSVQADAALRSRIPAPQSPQTLHTQENKPCIREIAQSSRQEREEKSRAKPEPETRIAPPRYSAAAQRRCSSSAPLQCSAAGPTRCSSSAPTRCSSSAPLCSVAAQRRCSSSAPLQHSAATHTRCSAAAPTRCSAVAPTRCSSSAPFSCSAWAPRLCVYCRCDVPAHAFQDHLVRHHWNQLFHCDECDKDVDRREFGAHITKHAIEGWDDTPSRCEPSSHAPRYRIRSIRILRNGAQNANSTNQPDQTPVKGENHAKMEPENEFSDHSDAEYGFAPLPESVFEAIEDTQDDQPATDNEEESSLRRDEEEASDRERTATPPAVKPVGSRASKRTRSCPICGKTYTASSSYFYHVKQHNNIREHECDLCAKKFATKSCLTQHKLTHSQETKYGCEECGKRFRCSASLYIHAQTHNGVKKWRCEECPRAFRWRTHLRRHSLRHAGSRAHACQHCGRGFSVRADLLRHARTHAAGAHACQHCGLNFAQPRYLKVHLAKKHSADD